MNLIDYIKYKYGGNKAAFARANGVQPQQVTQWVNKGFIVVDGFLYSRKRKLSRAT